MQVPAEFATSKGLQYIIQKGWNWRKSDNKRVELETCPLCKKGGYTHFYMITDGTKDDGLWVCHKCGKSGVLNGLKEDMGDKNPYMSDPGTKGESEQMPDIQKMHDDLLADEDAMDYLVNERGFSKEAVLQEARRRDQESRVPLSSERQLCIRTLAHASSCTERVQQYQGLGGTAVQRRHHQGRSERDHLR
jgi:hypothetical protein